MLLEVRHCLEQVVFMIFVLNGVFCVNAVKKIFIIFFVTVMLLTFFFLGGGASLKRVAGASGPLPSSCVSFVGQLWKS